MALNIRRNAIYNVRAFIFLQAAIFYIFTLKLNKTAHQKKMGAQQVNDATNYYCLSSARERERDMRTTLMENFIWLSINTIVIGNMEHLFEF